MGAPIIKIGAIACIPSYLIVKKILRRWLAECKTPGGATFLQRYRDRLKDPRLWHLTRRSVARSVAAGAIGGLVPGPLQMLVAALLALLLRGNVPLAMLVTLYSNPLTIGPLYWLAYRLGMLFVGTPNGGGWPLLSSVFDVGLAAWLQELLDWALALGPALLLGLPLLAILFAVFGYMLVNLAWRLHVLWQLRLRRQGKRRS